ncbi:MAG: hypothetical protein JNL24_02700 [Bacteroidia bacterium]|nr:hypothetical protein [Bacteroidia bacterium]
MKRLLQLLILILLTGCSMSKYYTVFVEHIDSRAEGDRFIDSLKAAGQDTIIGYYDGCSGCIQGLEKPYYIFWDSGNKWHLTKFTKYSRFNQITGYSPPIKYTSEYFETIDSLKLTVPEFEMSHFPYDVVRIVLNGKEINYEIKDYEKWNNESAPKVILIDKIRSKLFDVLPSEWKGLDYKTEKRRKDSA